jgi:hypothetical protein
MTSLKTRGIVDTQDQDESGPCRGSRGIDRLMPASGARTRGDRCPSVPSPPRGLQGSRPGDHGIAAFRGQCRRDLAAARRPPLPLQLEVISYGVGARPVLWCRSKTCAALVLSAPKIATLKGLATAIPARSLPLEASLSSAVQHRAGLATPITSNLRLKVPVFNKRLCAWRENNGTSFGKSGFCHWRRRRADRLVMHLRAHGRADHEVHAGTVVEAPRRSGGSSAVH